MHRAHAVDVGGTVGDDEVADVHHAQIDVHGLPEVRRELRTRCRALGCRCEGPAFTIHDGLRVFLAVLEQSADPRFFPRIEDRYAEASQELPDAGSPAGTFFHFATRDEVHRTREVHASAVEIVVDFAHDDDHIRVCRRPE